MLASNTCTITKNSGQQPCPLFLFRPQISCSVTSLCHITCDQNDAIICGTDSGELMLWSLTTYRLQSIINSNNNTRVIHLMSFGNGFVAQHKNGVINVFNDKLIIDKSFPCSEISFCKCFLHVCSTSAINWLSVVSQTNNRLIDIIDVNSDDMVCTVGIDDSKYGMCMTQHITRLSGDNADDKQVLLLIGYENGFLTLFNVKFCEKYSSQLMSQLKCFDSEIITCMDFNESIKCGVCGSIGDTASVWRINVAENSSISLTLKRNIKLTNQGLLSCAIRADGRVLATGGSDYRIRIFSCKSLKPLAVIDNHKQPIDCVLFTEKLINKEMGYLLIAASRDKTISVWSLYNN